MTSSKESFVSLTYRVPEESRKNPKCITLISGEREACDFGRSSNDPEVTQFFHPEDCQHLSAKALNFQIIEYGLVITATNNRKPQNFEGYEVKENRKSHKIGHKESRVLKENATLEFKDRTGRRHCISIDFAKTEKRQTVDTGTDVGENYAKTIFLRLTRAQKTTASVLIAHDLLEEHIYYGRSGTLTEDQYVKIRGVKNKKNWQTSLYKLRQSVIEEYAKLKYEQSAPKAKLAITKETDKWTSYLTGMSKENEYDSRTKNSDMPQMTKEWVQECELSAEEVRALVKLPEQYTKK